MTVDAFYSGLPPAEPFVTKLFAGTGGPPQSIDTGQNLKRGGLVWTKRRNLPGSHFWHDTVRGPGFWLPSDTTEAGNSTYSDTVSAFTTTGFDLGTDGIVTTPANYVAWCFPRRRRFFDVVKYTGDDGATQTLNHGLYADPGLIVVKRLDSTASNWRVWHRSAAGNLTLDNDDAQDPGGNIYVTSADRGTFTVGTHNSVNESGVEYVAYLWAHYPDDIACGSYTGNGTGAGPTIDLGWQPKWIMGKCLTLGSTSFWVVDDQRGINTSAIEPALAPNAPWDEGETGLTEDWAELTASGFRPMTGLNSRNASGATYVYVAVRA